MSDITHELIRPREGEELDVGVVEEYLRGKLPGSEGPLAIEQFAGGHANLTYCLRYGETEYVLRRPPLGPVAPKSHDMAREFKVLSVLYKAFPPAPRAFLLCEDESVIGAPFFVMERRRGTVVRGVIPPEFGGGADPEKNRALSAVCIDALVELHAVDYEAVGLADLGKPEGYMERQIDGWAGRFERAKVREIAVADKLVDWMKENMPPPPAPTILHNDWRLDNMMLDPADPSKVAGVFDWDMSTLGDPLSDLGTLFSLWIEPKEAAMVGNLSGGVNMPTHAPGFMGRREAAERYAEGSGRDISHIVFYYVFGLYKIAVVLEQIYSRYHAGQTKDERFKNFGKLTELLMSTAFLKVKQKSL